MIGDTDDDEETITIVERFTEFVTGSRYGDENMEFFVSVVPMMNEFVDDEGVHHQINPQTSFAFESNEGPIYLSHTHTCSKWIEIPQYADYASFEAAMDFILFTPHRRSTTNFPNI